MVVVEEWRRVPFATCGLSLRLVGASRGGFKPGVGRRLFLHTSFPCICRERRFGGRALSVVFA